MNKIKFVITCEELPDGMGSGGAAVSFSDPRVEDCGMKDYLAVHGWHFSKALCDYAVSRMKGRSFVPVTKDHVDIILRQNGIVLNGNTGYDAVYVYNMARSDFFGSSIPNDQLLVLFVKDYIDDADGYEGLPLRRYAADCEGMGAPIDWTLFL